MASKQRSLPISDEAIQAVGAGRRRYLRTAEVVDAEQAELERRGEEGPEVQDAGLPESQNASTPAPQNTGKKEEKTGTGRKDYDKATYRLSPKALEAIDETKRLLRREYQIKVTLEDIAEEAILMAYQDLAEHGKASKLVNKFSGKPDNRSAEG